MAKVLVVDDNAVNRNLVATVLSFAGHQVVEAADGAVALELMRVDRPDLVITDVLMPVMDGYRLVRDIRADPKLTGLPIVFYTANYLEREIRPFAAATGVRHILVKPVNPAHLIEIVGRALADEPISDLPLPDEDLDREHLRILNLKLIQRVDELERMRAELRHRSGRELAEARFRSAFDASRTGFCLGESDGTVAEVNRAFLDLVGCSRADLTTVGWYVLLMPGDLEVLSRDLRSMSIGGLPQFEATFNCRYDSGPHVPVRLSLGLVPRDPGEEDSPVDQSGAFDDATTGLIPCAADLPFMVVVQLEAIPGSTQTTGAA